MNDPPAVEREVGMECYATDFPPCPARLKAAPEDFQVEEIFGELPVSASPVDGYFPLYKVEKRLVDTIHLERMMGDALKSRVSTSGMKDKVSTSTQYATPTSTRARTPSVVEGRGFSAKLVGYVPRPLSRGSAAGNRFRVTARECCAGFVDVSRKVLSAGEGSRLLNFFGLQRFGGGGALTHRVGRSIVRRDFAGAVEVLLSPRPSGGERGLEAAEAIKAGRFAEGAALLPRGRDAERAVAESLSRQPDDPVKALRAVPIRVRRLYVQAFQSYLFNRTLSRAARSGIDASQVQKGDNWGEPSADGLSVAKVHGVREPIREGAVPLIQLVGYAYRNYGSRFDSCIERVMSEEGVAARDFYVEEMPELSQEGGFRRPSMVVKEATVEQEGTDATLSFVLGRGNYATVLLREAIKPVDPVAAGFA